MLVIKGWSSIMFNSMEDSDEATVVYYEVEPWKLFTLPKQYKRHSNGSYPQ